MCGLCLVPLAMIWQTTLWEGALSSFRTLSPFFAEQSTKYNKLPSDATYRHYIYIDYYLREFKQSRMQYHVNKEQRDIPGTEFLTIILPSSSAKHQIQSRNQQPHPINGQSHTTTNKLSSPANCMPHHSDKTTPETRPSDNNKHAKR